VATGLKKGDAVIAATFMGVSGATTLRVSDALLLSIDVTPVNASVPAGQTQLFTATGRFSDTTTRNLTDEVTWTSSDTAIAQISNADGSHGAAKGLARGASTITATLDDISAAVTFNVTGAVLVSIGVTPVNPSVPLGLTQAFTATGTFTDDTTLDLTNAVTWTSSDTAVAQISNADESHGLATTLAKGTTDITATLSDISGQTTMTVTDVALVSLAITPDKPSVPFRLTQAFTATGTFSDKTTRELTAEVTWLSSTSRWLRSRMPMLAWRRDRLEER